MKRPNDIPADPLGTLVAPDLVDRCKRGDEQAWAELVTASYREVYTLCLRILRDPDDASEATQDTFLKVWRGLRGFRGDAQFSTWLYRVATNAAISKHRARSRRRSRETRVDEEQMSELPSTKSTEALAGARLELDAVEKALVLLPDHYRAAVVLRDVYGMSIGEIANELKISPTAAKVRVHRGRKRVKESLFPSGVRDDDDRAL